MPSRVYQLLTWSRLLEKIPQPLDVDFTNGRGSETHGLNSFGAQGKEKLTTHAIMSYFSAEELNRPEVILLR